MTLNRKGQSTVEFLLVLPVFLLIVFCIIQSTYIGYAVFTVQRAASSIARSAASSEDPTSYNPTVDIFYTLYPLSRWNNSILSSILLSQCSIETQGMEVKVHLTFPLPIWIPGMSRIFGQKIALTNNLNENDLSSALNMLQLAGLKITTPDTTNIASHYFYPITSNAEAINESSLAPGD